MKGIETESTLIEWQVIIISCPKKEKSSSSFSVHPSS
jgi:hypothetical protein